MKHRFATAIGLMAAMGCNQQMTAGSTLKVGVLFAQTGSNSSVGLENIDSVSLAIDEINKAGGVLDGLKLEPVLADTKSTVEDAKIAAERLAEAKVPLVFGDWSSARTQQAIRVFRAAKIVEIAVATSPATESKYEPDDGYFFRAMPSDAHQTRLMARRAIDQGRTKMSVIHMPGAYGDGLTAAFEAAFTEFGGTLYKKIQYTEEQASYTNVLNQIFADPVQAIALFGYAADGATIIKDYNTQFSEKQIAWYFTDAVEESAFVTGVGTANNNWSFPHEGYGPAAASGANNDAFINLFKTRFAREPETGTCSRNTYDAVYVGALAIQQAGVADATAIRDALHKVGGPPGEKFGHVQFKEAIAALKAGNDVDYDGVTGPIDFDAEGEVLAPYHVWRVTDGKIVVVTPSISPP